MALAFNRELWGEFIRREDFPKFRCPNCANGHLFPDAKTITIEEPKYSKASGGDENWEPDWTRERFIGFLRCDIPSCGEIVTVSGDTAVIEDYDEELGWNYLTVLRPQAFCPSPPIIELPEQVSKSVASHVSQSFQLYWIDLSACANRLRASVEYLLDDFKMPRDTISKKTGKPERLDLNGRIAAFEKLNPEHAKTLTALRMIGNLGSHGSDVSREVILDAYEIYEDCLVELYGQRKQRMDKLKQKIIDAKGKY